jgi:putative ABC transport system ATP-binding protein
MTGDAIEARGISKVYDGVDGAITTPPPTDLTLAAGELVAVTGAAQSGKTTLVHLLAGWLAPDRGSVSWQGRPDPPGWPQLTVIPQSLALLDELTVTENVTLPGRGRGRPAAPAPTPVDALLDRLGLLHLGGRSTAEISVGERQRVMVARAVASGPEVVLADEPTAHQDDRHAGLILGLLAETVSSGAACLVATHDVAIAAQADRTVPLPTAAGAVAAPGAGPGAEP